LQKEGFMRGRFIVIEGMDGAGTTTQTRLLRSHFEKMGRRVHATSEPTSQAVGRVIRTLLSGHVESKHLMATLALLFAADRLIHFDDEIGPKLVDGVDVICDRYVLSSLVYQGLDLPSQWVASLNQFAPAPDLTIILDTPADVALSRRESRGGEQEIFEKAQLQENIRRRYLKLSEQPSMALVDGQGELETVSHRILDLVRPLLEKTV
jgi:dTMP kinase